MQPRIKIQREGDHALLTLYHHRTPNALTDAWQTFDQGQTISLNHLRQSYSDVLGPPARWMRSAK